MKPPPNEKQGKRIADAIARCIGGSWILVGDSVDPAIIERLADAGLSVNAESAPSDTQSGATDSTPVAALVDCRPRPRDIALSRAAFTDGGHTAHVAAHQELISNDLFVLADSPDLPEVAALCARRGFTRDHAFDAEGLELGLFRFRRRPSDVGEIVWQYEIRLSAIREGAAKAELRARAAEAALGEARESASRLAAAKDSLEEQARTHRLARERAESRAQDALDELRALEEWRSGLQSSPAWAIVSLLQLVRTRLTPPESRRDRLAGVMAKTLGDLRTGWPSAVWGELWRQIRPPRLINVEIEPVRLPRADHPPRATRVDIVVCVHNALEDVPRCLESVIAHTQPPFRLLLIDDGSAEPTRRYLESFADEHGAELARNPVPLGYTRAANQGLTSSDAPFVLLLNSDTVVSDCWLERLVACAESDPTIGVVGPLSNTASWQSIPQLSDGDDWATNPLPEGVSITEMARLVADHSAQAYPRVRLLNGFCLLIRRALMDDIGVFDEKTFGPGYGEEDDFTLRAQAAGWQLVVADDTYIYHAQSRSYSMDGRHKLTKAAGAALANKHGQETVAAAVDAMLADRVMHGIRARSAVLAERLAIRQAAAARYAGRRVLFLLPVTSANGGANVVLYEAAALQSFGVEVAIFNLWEYREGFERHYPALSLPVAYGHKESLAALAEDYDAVVATANYSVSWLEPLVGKRPTLGYYIQGFEPYMYEPGTSDHENAWRSYTALPGLRRFAKTEWVSAQVREKAGAPTATVGVSADIDLFRPRPRAMPAHEGILRIAAMIRPSSAYRAPQLTMELLGEAARYAGRRVEIWIFGIPADDPEFLELERDFDVHLTGRLGTRQMARFMNEVHAFADFSSHQAMGLSALEAMACGAVPIVPRAGGATEYARHGVNALVVDTESAEDCWHALKRILDNPAEARAMGRQGIEDVSRLYPEKSALRIAEVLFDDPDEPVP